MIYLWIYSTVVHWDYHWAANLAACHWWSATAGSRCCSSQHGQHAAVTRREGLCGSFLPGKSWSTRIWEAASDMMSMSKHVDSDDLKFNLSQLWSIRSISLFLKNLIGWSCSHGGILERILELSIGRLSNSWANRNDQGRFFFFTAIGHMVRSLITAADD